MRRGALSALLLLCVLPSRANAHTRLLRSTPAAGVTISAAPLELRLVFSEAPELAYTSIVLRASDGAVVTLSPPAIAAGTVATVVCGIRGEIRSGRYTVEWQAGGADGHPVKGRYTFTVSSVGAAPVAPVAETQQPKARSVPDTSADHHDPALMPQAANAGTFGSESPLYAAVRWLQFVGLLVVIGAAAFGKIVLGAMPQFHPADAGLVRTARARASRVGLWGVAIVACSAVLRLVAQSYAIHGSIDAVTNAGISVMLRETSWGAGWLLQIAGAAIAGWGFFIAARRSGDSASLTTFAQHERARMRGWSIAACAAIVLAFTPGLASHAASAPRLSVFAMIADGLHVLGAGGWVGGLTALVLAGIPAAWALPGNDRGPAVAALVNAFSPTALVFAGIVATTGVFAAWLHVGSLDALRMTMYGRLLLTKLAVVSLLAGAGAYNWRRVKPQLGSEVAAQRIRRSASAEILFGVIVLVVTAVLVATPAAADMQM